MQPEQVVELSGPEFSGIKCYSSHWADGSMTRDRRWQSDEGQTKNLSSVKTVLQSYGLGHLSFTALPAPLPPPVTRERI